MIEVTRLDGSKFYVNAELIEFMESTPDTVLTLSSGKKVVVRDRLPDIVDRVVAYKRQLAKQPDATDECSQGRWSGQLR